MNKTSYDFYEIERSGHFELVESRYAPAAFVAVYRRSQLIEQFAELGLTEDEIIWLLERPNFLYAAIQASGNFSISRIFKKLSQHAPSEEEIRQLEREAEEIRTMDSDALAAHLRSLL